MNYTNVSWHKREMFDQEAEYIRIKFFLLRKFLLPVCNIHKTQVYKQNRYSLKYEFSMEGVF